MHERGEQSNSVLFMLGIMRQNISKGAKNNDKM